MFDDEQVEQIVREMLKSGNITFGSSTGDYNRIQETAAKLEFIKQPSFNEIVLSDEDFRKCKDKLWDYLIIGVLAPGLNPSNPNFPWVHVTEYGKKFLKGDVNPYSADEYMAKIQHIADLLLDDIAEDYLFEAIRSFRHSCYLGATVLLGGFSERIFLNFLREFKQFIKDQTKRQNFEKKIKNAFISQKFKAFLNLIEPLKKKFPKDIRDQIDLWLSSFFNYIRSVRNEVGHPTGRTFSRGEVLAMFLPFPAYLENLIKLLNHFKNDPIL